MATSGYMSHNGKPDVGWWMDRMDEGLRYRRYAAMEDHWHRWYAYTRGEWRPGILPVNLFFTMMRTIVPRIYFRNPDVSIVSTKPGPLFMGFAKLLERVDAKLIRQMRLKTAMQEMVQDAFLYGTGTGTLGFGAQYEYRHEGYVEAPRVRGNAIEYRDHVVPQMPWFARIHPRNYVAPADVMKFTDGRWSTMFVERAVEDVMMDERLDSRARKEVKSGWFFNGTQLRVGHHRKSQFTRTGYNREDIVELAVIRDKKTQRVIVLSPDVGSSSRARVLFSGPDALQGDGFPDFQLIFNPDSECAWGVPDSQILEPYQREINEIRTQSMKHRRLALIKLLARRNAIDPEEITKMFSENVGSVVWTNADPTNAVVPFQVADIPQSLFLAGNQVMQDVRDSVGFSRNQLGEFNSQTAETTATEAQIVAQAAEIRVDERRDMAADLLTDIIEGVHNLVFNQWTQTEVVEVVGPGGVPVWVQFTPDMLKQGQYHVKVDPDSSIPETKQTREQRAYRIYQFLVSNPMIDPYKLTQYLLNETHGTAFDDMMRGLPPIGGGGQTVGAEGYGNMIRQSIGQYSPEQAQQQLLAQQAQAAGIQG